MRIYQPMMFIGLGGTGCRIGAELERRLREELCGPDGQALLDSLPGQGFLPYQLPGCLQFVYADLAEDEFGRVESRSIPDPAYLAAAEKTHQMVRELVPIYDNYPDLARSLRLMAREVVEGWLPPSSDEPRVGPLAKGAGQLPTIGRAALFETFRGGLAPAQRSLNEGIGHISNSGGQLAALGGRLQDSVDVFVAFSVAGGTGAGLFYDYLHLVGDALDNAGYKARIFPLVLMPSAFEEGLGGGRAAELNAGRALPDLFRLVDDQNSQVAGTDLDYSGIDGSLTVRYPNNSVIRLRASTVQTAFLFSLTAGMHRDDLHRSVVSLLLSLIGTELPRDHANAQIVDHNFQSFADSFINSAVERGVPAPTGIGRRGVSTSSVASMTAPVDELAEIISSRLLADAVLEIAQPQPGETNRELIGQLFQDANIDPLLHRQPLAIDDEKSVDGYPQILDRLAERKRTMTSKLQTHEQQLKQQVPDLATRFDPRRAFTLALRTNDPFRLRRTVFGDPVLGDDLSRLGFAKVVESRRSEPKAPEDITLNGPIPAIPKPRMFRRVLWADEAVQECLRKQDQWNKWRSQRAWHREWDAQANRWERRLRKAEIEMDTLTEAFLNYARGEDARFARRAKALYEPRVGVSYLLPRQPQLLNFYQSVLRRLVDVFADQNQLLRTASPADVVAHIVGAQGWQCAYEELQEHGLDEGPLRAVAAIRGLIKAEVLRIFRYQDDMHEPLLASMHDLLLAAAGRANGTVNEEDLLQFRQQLAGLVPGGFAPAGSGRLKILISYQSPGGRRDPNLETFLQREVLLPRETGLIVEFRPIDAESIIVVLFRSSMGLTEVPEVRQLLSTWSNALQGDQSTEFLQWRQRVGYRFGTLADTEDQARILQRLLCAVWNGYVHTIGEAASPSAITVRLGNGESEVKMRLELSAYGKTSSWASVFSAYERWVLADSTSIRRSFCERLMDTLPLGLTDNLRAPSKLFEILLQLASTEPDTITQLIEGTKSSAARRRQETVQQFWRTTFADAMNMEFRGVGDPQANNLAELFELANQ